MLRLEGRGPDRLVFLPGFMTSARAYLSLLTPIAVDGYTVIVPQLYPRGIATLQGRHGVREEAAAAVELVIHEAVATPGRVYLAGHSRGGLAAWLAAGQLSDRLAGLYLVDPVDASSRAGGPPSVRHDVDFGLPTAVLGAGIPGPCAPAGMNHERFAEATPHAAHVVVGGLGHADLLGGWERKVGRRVCGGGPDPDRAREIASLLLGRFLAGRLPEVGPHRGFDRLR